MSIKHLIYRKGGVPGATAKHRQLLQSEDYDYSGATEPIEEDAVESTTSDPIDTSDSGEAITNVDPYEFTSQYRITEKNPNILQGITHETKGIVDIISNGVGGEIILTSGLRQKKENEELIGHAEKSFHLEGRAIDIRTTPESDAYLSSPQAKAALAAKGYEIIDERDVYDEDGKQIPPHWHIEPMPGGIVTARRGGLIYKC
jgi:hypothetical protein